MFTIGGNDSADTARRLSDGAKHAGKEITVVHVPKTIDNDLPGTDHTPGYGSAARFVALATMGVGRDAEAMGPASPVAATPGIASIHRAIPSPMPNATRTPTRWQRASM